MDGRYRSACPASAGRWTNAGARSYPRDELARALVAGRVAGVATHPLDNVRGNARLLLEGDPDKQFGLTGSARTVRVRRTSSIWCRAGAGAPIDPTRQLGDVQIAPEPILDACEALGRRLALARRRRRARADRHRSSRRARPPVPRARADCSSRTAGACSSPPTGQRGASPIWTHDWSIGYLSGVGMLTDGRVPRHTHRPDAMRADARPTSVPIWSWPTTGSRAPRSRPGSRRSRWPT